MSLGYLQSDSLTGKKRQSLDAFKNWEAALKNSNFGVQWDIVLVFLNGEPGMVAHIYNPSIQMTEAGGWSQVQGEPELQSEILKDLKQIILNKKNKTKG